MFTAKQITLKLDNRLLIGVFISEYCSVIKVYDHFFFCGNQVDFNEARLQVATLILHAHT